MENNFKITIDINSEQLVEQIVKALKNEVLNTSEPEKPKVTQQDEPELLTIDEACSFLKV